MQKMVYIFLLIKYGFLRLITVFSKRGEYWIIQERGNDARDNGYYFYKYMVEEHPEKKVYYVITKDSVDYYKIKTNDILIYGSLKHTKKVFKAEVILSAHMPYSGLKDAPNIFKKLLFLKHKSVFLQHGITKDYIDFITKEKGYDIDLFICGAHTEYEYIRDNYGFTADVVKYTGFSRFDRLLKNKNVKKQILVMPTWRSYLNNKSNKEFCDSEYYKNWNNLLSDDVFWNSIIERNMEIIFYIHPEMQKRIDLFQCSKKIIIGYSTKFDLSQLIEESIILITDYSSIFFDFAYMYKSVLYFQFDYEEYRKNHLKKGYYDYKTMGFGPVSTSQVQLKDNIHESIANDLSINEKYKSRVDYFFPIRDRFNSQRIYNEVIKIANRGKKDE